MISSLLVLWGELTMRSVLAALALLAGASAASAEVWLMREGRCGEYRSRWDVEQDQPGVWVGAADHVQVGGPCVARTGVNSRSRVRAVIVGQEFFAILQSEPASGAAVHSGQICSYYGPVRDDQVRGVEVCEGGERMMFALRFRPEGDREVQQRSGPPPADQQDDDRPDNPQTSDPDRTPPGWRDPRR
jgi:hypothetical protein